MEEIKLGDINHTKQEHIFCGGKGINVSIVLKALDWDSVALGFIAGFTGKEIEERVKQEGIITDFVSLAKGQSRINVKVKAETETEFNAQGPGIEKEEIDELFQKLEQIKDGDTLVLAGSIPASLPCDIYEDILHRLQPKKIRIIVDATKDLLKKVLRYHPFLIKPNHHELAELFGITITTPEEIIHYAKELQVLGAQNVLISMASKGAILVDEFGKVHTIGVPKGVVKNSVGAGDSMVAGFLAGYLRTSDYGMALELGTAAGSATAFSDGIATKEYITQMLRNLKEVER